jgi:hypothetical protein
MTVLHSGESNEPMVGRLPASLALFGRLFWIAIG